MERLIVEVSSQKHIDFLFELLRKFDFISRVKKAKPTQKNNMPIQWSKRNADVMSLAGIWKNRPRTIEEIREKSLQLRFSYPCLHTI